MAGFRWILFLLLLGQASSPSIAKNPCNSAQLNKGVVAFQSGNLGTAVKAFAPSAMRGCAEAMHNMGVLASILSMQGRGPDNRDLAVDAYMWFTLAAHQHPQGPHRENSLSNRAVLTLNAEQIVEGERLAKAWRAGQKLPAQRPLASGRGTVVDCTMPDGSKMVTSADACSQSGGEAVP